MDTIASRLSAARHAAGLTQAAAASRLAVTSTSVARWEMRAGHFRPTLAHLEALAALYGVTPGILMDGVQASPSSP
jgi:transcriptional regulator with XRE-family HTH domain